MIKDVETQTVALVNIPVELRNASGQILQTAMTDSAGKYEFTIPPGEYFVGPVANRTESVWGPNTPTTDGMKNDFQIHAVPARIQVSGSPGTFVLATYTPWTAAVPPMQGRGSMVMSVTSVIGLDGTAKLKLPGNHAYYLTCWTLTDGRYLKGASVPINGGNPVMPQSAANEVCP